MTIAIDTRSADTSDACRSRLRSLVVRLEPTSRTLRIETDDERVERYVRTAYGNVLAAAPPEPTNTATLLTAPGSASVSFEGVVLPREAEGAGTPWESDAFVVDQFVWRALATDPDWLSLYACAVVVEGRAVLIVGASGVGKTTLALALHRRGACVLGDEMAVIHRREQTVEAIDRRLTVRLGSGHGTGDRRVLALDRRVLGEAPPPATLAATFVVARGAGTPAAVPASAGRTALTIASYLGARPTSLADVTDVGGVLAKGRCFALTLGEPDATARVVLEALRAC